MTNFMHKTLMEEHYTSHPLCNNISASRIMRRSIFTFLQGYQFFSLTPSILLLPFAVTALVSSPLVSASSLFPSVHRRLGSLFLAAGLPPSSELFVVLNFKLAQTIISSLFVSPFALSFLLLAKASVIGALEPWNDKQKHALFSRTTATFRSLLATQLCNALLIISVNATCLVLLIVSFDCADALGLSSPKPRLILSATGAIAYSIVLANTYVICNLSLIVSGLDVRRGGFTSILEACVLIRGRTATALSLTVPINVVMAGVDALFQYRVVRAYRHAMAPDSSMVLEAMLLAYLYAMLIVIDTIVGYMFLKTCRSNYQILQEDIRCHKIEIQETDGKNFMEKGCS